MWTYNYSNELYHHGILGMKWGVRRYQNKDGTLTAAGKERYGSSASGQTTKKNKDGTLTAAGKERYGSSASGQTGQTTKKNKNWIERAYDQQLFEHDVETVKNAGQYNGEYNKTPEGKKLAKKWEDASSKLYEADEASLEQLDDEDYDAWAKRDASLKPFRDKANKAQSEYLYNAGKHQATKLIEDMGAERFARVLSRADKAEYKADTDALIELWGQKSADGSFWAVRDLHYELEQQKNKRTSNPLRWMFTPKFKFE